MPFVDFPEDKPSFITLVDELGILVAASGKLRLDRQEDGFKQFLSLFSINFLKGLGLVLLETRMFRRFHKNKSKDQDILLFGQL
ncbi:hypothetical protein PPACK8108_LOCUS26205 [Phakopsora pachyrhizi]|uniref:Uncharacterized protein n=1 Tax=Phakopsora pachyrhizi TaxID=170000 RepID=A0AAV0ALR8_PHAPC|nr:hypothetical protein PPACK8108_LOCUS2419 [Phakopsora pachyrhizi]CAH7674082.1 hypothetical protein PPACK8108_LOCUS8980 [Phakopsora pachyrhizi]CAH7690771.1 hypothetical protein PPACK8108_LOCUS26205 [Phakopsora pachyrhizi]